MFRDLDIILRLEPFCSFEVANEHVLDQLGIAVDDLASIQERAEAELERRDQAYRGGRPLPPLEDNTVILVDDGIATGATMRAAADAVRLLGPCAVVVAVPTSARDSANWIGTSADRVIALSMPEPYMAVGAWYQYFPQLSDAEVVDFLARSREALA